jgi:uncharacterized protein YggL (DUF469 family)
MTTSPKESTDSFFDKIMPALDRYMLAKYKMSEMIVKTGTISPELAQEVSNAHDQLTIQWMKQETLNKLKTNERRE